MTWQEKGKHFPVQTIKAYRRSIYIAPITLNLTQHGSGLVHYQFSLHLVSKCPGVNWPGGWIGLTARLDILEKRHISCSWMTKQSPDQWMGDRHYVNQQPHTSPSPTWIPVRHYTVSFLFPKEITNMFKKKKAKSVEETFFFTIYHFSLAMTVLGSVRKQSY